MEISDSIDIAVVLTPPTERNLLWASQVGATNFVARYPTVSSLEKMRAEQERVASYGLRLSVIEGYLPIDEIVRGTSGRDRQISEVRQLLQNMGRCGIPLLCYNFMQADWTRTSFRSLERGGALTSSFDLAQLAGHSLPQEFQFSSDEMWNHLSYFLERIIPVAEENGVKLAMHPDDPPLPSLLGAAQIMFDTKCFERLFDEFPSSANGMCFCQGTFAEAGFDIPETIRHFGDRIHYIHFRDVQGTASNFVESFHDNGKTDMAAAMRAYREIGFNGPMRPDHVPLLAEEGEEATGYTMLGRLFAIGYMRGLLHATAPLERTHEISQGELVDHVH